MNYTLIIIALLLLFTIIGLKYKKLMNPVFVFNSSWFCCFFLFSLEFSRHYSNKLSLKAFFVFLIMILSFNCMFFLGLRLRHIRLINSVSLLKIHRKITYLYALFIIWLVLTFMEVIYCGGLPLVWKILGSSGTYATFGVPSVHGFINSLSWFILNVSFIYYLNTQDKKALSILIAINLIYIMLLARQSLTTEAIQLMCIYVLKRKVNFGKIIKYLLFGVIIFGILGNIRTGAEHILQTAGLIIDSVPLLLMGFIWAYLYLMTPLANMIFMIDTFSDFQFGLLSITRFLPTVIVNLFDLPKFDKTDLLVHQTYNVSTALFEPYGDFGIIGVLLFFLLLGYWGAGLWRSLRINNFLDIDVCNYAIYLGILATNVFSNLLLSLPIVMQLIYTNVLFKNYFEGVTEKGDLMPCK